MIHRVDISRDFLVGAVTADGIYDLTPAAWQAAEQAVADLRKATEFLTRIIDDGLTVRVYGPSGRELDDMAVWLSDVLADSLYPDAGSYPGQRKVVTS